MEAGSVEIEAKELVDRLETRGVSSNGVVGGRKTVRILVPRGRTWEDGLNEDGCNVHVAKCPCEHWQGTGRAPDEHAPADDDG